MTWKSKLGTAGILTLSVAILATACSSDGDETNDPALVAGAGGMIMTSTGGMGGLGGEADGGEAGDVAEPPRLSAPEITTVSLPSGSFNQDYGVTLEASGGSGEGYAWSLTNGALPIGLELSAAGLISGVPLEGGSFDFEVTLSDSNEMKDNAELTLKVTRSRWFVYTNNLELRAVDLTSETPERIVISQDLPANIDGLYGTHYLSPDGRFASYVVRVSGEWSTTELRIADLDVDPPTEVVATELAEERFYGIAEGWSPDSQNLATVGMFEDDLGQLLEPSHASFVNAEEVLSSPRQPSDFVRLGPALMSTLRWLSPDIVLYMQDEGWDEEGFRHTSLVYSVREAGVFSAPQVLTHEGLTYPQENQVHYVDHASRRAVIGASNQPHCVTMDLFDFAAGIADFGDEPRLPSPGLDLFAGTPEATLDVIDTAQQAIATLGASACDLVKWSESGHLLGWVSTDDQQYQVTRIAADRQSTETWAVPNGTYTTTVERPTFSPDDGWLAYRADGNLFVARIEADEIGNAVRVNSELAAPDTERVNAYSFAPNGKGLVYGAAEQVPGIDELYFVDLSSGAPAAPLRISPDLSGFPDGDEVLLPGDYDPPEYSERDYRWTPWAPDSSKVVFVVSDSARQVADTLYVVDMLAPQPAPVQADSGSCDEFSCGYIYLPGPYSFQPPR